MKNPEIKIREFVAADYDGIVNFVDELQLHLSELDILGEVKAFGSKGDAKSYLDQALIDSREMAGVIYIAECEGQLAGFIQGVIMERSGIMHFLTHRKGKEGWIGLLFTDQKLRGKGIGRQLLHAMEEYFKSKQCDSMRLKCANNNDSAMNLYKKYGLIPRDVEMAMKL